MRWFLNISTGSKIFLGFGLIILLQLSAVLIFNSITALQKTHEKIYKKELVLIEELSDILNNQNSARAASLIIMASKSSSQQGKLRDEVEKLNKTINDSFQKIMTTVAGDSELTTKIQTLKKHYDEFSSFRNSLAAIATTNGTTFQESDSKFLDSLSENYRQGSIIVQDIISDSKQRMSVSLEHSLKEIKKDQHLFIGVGILSLLLAIVIAVLLSRIIANPLVKMSKLTEKITQGDLTVENLKIKERNDEVGILAKNFHSMVSNLRNLTLEISQVVNTLASSVSEISSTTTQLAASASQTASAVTQTTSTIEEVKQTSLLANNKAKAVSEVSHKSLEASHSGKKAAEEISKMTSEIHAEMEHIAESMVQLSEQSQAIGMIITTVDDLAQQSNLLSVNASIEAAKAGEQGKGFAVVAQEVKSLANQSKQATNQVRSILNDIQKATSTAVLATEQGNKGAEEREKKSATAGESIASLINTVVETTHAATQIAATSHQQLIGMEQAAIAMENIKQATAQNLTSSKQLESEAKNLKETGMKLKEMIGRYKL